jgi:predicted PurR-regulated permease PerM
MHVQALGLLLWSMLLVGTIDNILNPYIISRDSEIPSLFILFGILGGISLIGPVGILIGPLVLSLLFSLISIYKKNL